MKSDVGNGVKLDAAPDSLVWPMLRGSALVLRFSCGDGKVAVLGK